MPKNFLLLILLSLFHRDLTAQTSIESFPLGITCNKTTILIFPSAIKSVDRGAPFVLTRQPPGVPMVLKVKAARPEFPESSLDVITMDGKIYSFTVHYESNPLRLNYRFPADSLGDTLRVTNIGRILEDFNISTTAARIGNLKRHPWGPHEKSEKMVFRLQGIYISHDVLFFQFYIRNLSQISYDIDNIRFFIEDQKKARRMASQEMELIPVYSYVNSKTIFHRTADTCVFALPKFTLSRHKFLLLKLIELHGNRNLSLKIKNRKMFKGVEIL